MELLCILVLGFCGSVIASPYGYGAKGGALAKADASSAAGAFSGLAPFNIPSGAGGYSGSYSSSKSSSSSSASSSASSSSFSFSGSGSGIPGAPGLGGCLTGACKNNQVNGQPAAPFGSGSVSNSNSQAFGTESADLEKTNGPQSNCNGAECEKKTNCGTPNCNDGSTSDTKCSSGQCKYDSLPNSPVSEDDANDIQVNKLPIPTQPPYGQEPHSNKPNSECSFGKCTTSPYNSATNNVPNFSNPGAPECSTPDCKDKNNHPSAFDTAPKPSVSSYNKGAPSTYLTTPTELETTKLPSSYAVPIHGTYLSPGPKPACTTGDCDNKQVPSNTDTTGQLFSPNFLPPQPGNKCTSPNCTPSTSIPHANTLYTVPTNLPKCQNGNCGIEKPGVQYPNANIKPFSFGSSPAASPQGPLGSVNCKSPNCGGYQVTQPTEGDSPHSAYPSKGYSPPSNTYHPQQPSTIYETPKYPQPAGELSPPISNSPYYPSSAQPTPAYSNPSYTHPSPHGVAPILNSPYSPYNPTSSPHSQIPNHNIPPPSYNSPSSFPVHETAPSHTGTVPTFIGSSPTHGTIPSYTAPLPSYNKPSSSIGCTSPNCQTNGSPSILTNGTPYNPNASVAPNKEKNPPYTGGFGGPPGLLKPNEYSVPSKPAVPHSPSIPSSTPVSHLPSSHPIGPAPAPAFPSGNLYNKPSSVDCTSGLCNSNPGSLEPHSPKPGCGNCPSVPGHIGCSNGNCPLATGPSSPHPTGFHGSGNAIASAASSSSAGVYTGGFGGPPGFLKPYDNGKQGQAGGNYLSQPYSASQPHSPNNAGSPSTYDSKLNAGNAAQAGSISAASGNGNYNAAGQSLHDAGSKGDHGCGGGCGNGGNGNILEKNGLWDGSNGALGSAIASSKSQSGAISGAGGYGGSFASSSASAHSSAGAATKGGYGR